MHSPANFITLLGTCLIAILLLHSSSTPMVTGQMFGGGDVLNIAVVLTCLNYSHFPTGMININTTTYANIMDLILDTSVIKPSDCGTGVGGYNDWNRAYMTYQRVINEQGGIPFNATHKVQLKITYFNIGAIDYTSPQLQAQYTSAVTNAYILANMLGANNPAGTGGMFGRYPIIVPPPFADVYPQSVEIYGYEVPASLNEAFYSSCELSKACVVIGHYAGTENWMKCQSQPQAVSATQIIDMVPIECQKAYNPSLVADKRSIDRRYTHGLSALPTQYYMLAQTVAWFKLKGAASAWIVCSAAQGYQTQILPPGEATLKSNKISLLNTTTIPKPILTNLHWNSTNSYLSDLVAGIVAANPDLLILIPYTLYTTDSDQCFELLLALKKAGWTPKAVIIPGGATQPLALRMNAVEAGAGGYYYATTFNDVRIRNPNYDSVPLTALDFEPYPSNAATNTYSPITMHDEYVKDWGTADTIPSIYNGYIIPQIVTMVPDIACKLFHLAGSDDASLMAAASLSMAVPSQGGLLQFDQYGRLTQADQWVAQFGASGLDYHLITPLDVGENDIYPMPTWAERVAPSAGSASFLGTATEKGVVAVTTIVNAYLLFLLLGVVIRRNSQVMKSASPMFCITSLLGGMICISSNYGNSLYAVKEGCGANAWLLTTGFTLMFSSLFAKTWRIYKIFQSGKLQVVKITNTDLYVIVGILVGIDILVNCIWSGVTGFSVQYVTVDPVRPVYDYVQCSYGNQFDAFVYFHIAYKALIILCGIGLAIAARNVPAMFNETPYIAASMYNCTVLVAFLVPIVGAGVGSRQTNYLIRCYGLLVCVASTASILFVPKFYLLTQKSSSDTFGEQTAGGKKTQLTNMGSAASAQGASGSHADGVSTVPASNTTHPHRKNTATNLNIGSSIQPANSHPNSHLEPGTGENPGEPSANKYMIRRTHTPISPTQNFDESEQLRELRAALAEKNAEIATLRSRLQSRGSGSGNNPPGETMVTNLPGQTNDEIVPEQHTPEGGTHSIRMPKEEEL